MWSDQENINELKLKLMCTNFELESARTEAKNEITKHKEVINRLNQQLNKACQERDEAINQIENLLVKFLPSISADQTNPNPPQKLPKKDSFLDQILNRDLHPTQAFHRTFGGSTQVGLVSSRNSMVDYDVDLDFVDYLARGKALPQKGRLFQAVMKSGPLLQTLLVAPSPDWHNPPLLLSNAKQIQSNLINGSYYGLPHQRSSKGQIQTHCIGINSDMIGSQTPTRKQRRIH